MAFLISLILQILGITFVVSLLAILVERFLIINGFARGNTIALIVSIFFLATLFRLAYPEPSDYLYWFLMAFIGAIGGNRYDLTMTMKHGKWWWKKENQSQIQNLKS